MSKVKDRRGEEAGKQMADSLIEFHHLFYNKPTARRVLFSLLERLKQRYREFD